MIQELKNDAVLAWSDELKSIKVKLEKNEQVSFFRVCFGGFIHFINKLFFCFPNFNGSETQENFCNDRKKERSISKDD